MASDAKTGIDSADVPCLNSNHIPYHRVTANITKRIQYPYPINKLASLLPYSASGLLGMSISSFTLPLNNG